MSSDKPHSWKEKIDVSAEEYFMVPSFIPHPGLVKLVRILEDEIGVQRAHELLRQTVHELAKENVKKYGDQQVETWEDYLSLKDSGEYSHIFSKAIKIEDHVVTDGERRFNVPYCLWAKTWKELDADDIGYIWNCYADDVLAELMSPKLRLTRPPTIMQGGKQCKFCYTWEEDE